MPRLLRLLALAPLAALTLSCHIEEPFARDNHWDPGGNGVLSLVGPDSTFSIGDRISVSIVADPPLPPGPLTIEWTSIGSTDTAVHVFPAGYGEFVVERAHAEFALIAVAAYFEDNVVATSVVVGQKLGSLDLFCGTAAAPVTCDATPLGISGLRTVNSTMVDANGNAIRRRTGIMQRATAVVRDPAVCSTIHTAINAAGAWTLQGLAPGTTWVVITADGVRDSVRVVVGP